MPELLKNIYNREFFEEFTEALGQVYPEFDKSSFLNQIFSNDWIEKELKHRIRHITNILNLTLSGSYIRDVRILLNSIQWLQQNGIQEKSIEYMFIPDYIEQFGLNHYKVSIDALESITKFTSCEFAVRPFIQKYPDTMIEQMLEWSVHPHPMVRRLSSEGCRPRLPWAMAIPSLKLNPDKIIPILEALKNDDSESVRRSVANNLNDISKDNPSVVIRLSNKWHGHSNEINWVIKHGCRTLLKQGNAKVLNLFGFGSVKDIQIENIQIITPVVKIGGALAFQFQLINQSKTNAKIRLEYGIYYQKMNGSLSKKVFKISEKIYPQKSSTTIIRKQSFKIITTRKFHPGLHQLSIVINGTETKKTNFQLIENDVKV